MNDSRTTAKLWRQGDILIQQVNAIPGELEQHRLKNEHSPITFLPGEYRAWRQREFDSLTGSRWVAD